MPAILWYCFALFFDRLFLPLVLRCKRFRGVLLCVVLRSVYSFGPSFRVKPVVQVSSEKLTQFKCFAAILSSETFKGSCDFLFLLPSASFCCNFVAFRILSSSRHLQRRSGRRFGADVDDAPRCAHTSQTAFFCRFR